MAATATPGFCSVCKSVLALAACFGLQPAAAQTVRNYDAQFTGTAPTIDGVVSPGEWDAADAAAGDWRELRQLETDVDSDNNRFRVLWDANALYVLYETDYDFGWLTDSGFSNPLMNFNDEGLHWYFDPNTNGDPNFTSVPESNVDGYQFSFNQYLGAHLSVDADRDGIGFFTEAHVDSPFGDQANWNGGVAGSSGPALGTIRVAQVNTNPSDGVAEIEIPWVNFDADFEIMKTETGLFHPMAPGDGEQWFFNVAMITRDTNNFLPMWNWHPGVSFPQRPHGTLTFVPEPHTAAARMVLLFALALIWRHRARGHRPDGLRG